MQAYEIMKYYKDSEKAKKLLNQKVHPEIKISQINSIKKHKMLNINEERYFAKPVNKKEMASEIFFSRVYKQAGISVADYFPLGKHGFYTHVASNSIHEENKHCVEAGTYFCYNSPRALNGIKGEEARNEIFHNVFYMPKRLEDQHVNYSDFITDDAMKKLQIIRALDVCSKNTDRHGSNYFFVVDENNIVVDVVCIDFSMSGKNLGLKHAEYFYYNEFTADRLCEYELLKKMEDNEVLNTFVSPKELSEEVGAVDLLEVARDVKGDFGFTVPQKMVDNAARSFDIFSFGLTMV